MKNPKILVSVLVIAILSIICYFGYSSFLITSASSTGIKNASIKGMCIENLCVENEWISILTTTGAVFRVDLETGTIEINQRIGENRPVAKIKLAEDWFKKLSTPILDGFDCIWKGSSSEDFEMTISGDSVICFQNIKKVTINLKFLPIYQKVNDSNCGALVLDNKGGLVIVPPELYYNKDRPRIFKNNIWMNTDSWRLTANKPLSLLFVGVCPPRNFDWESSFIPVIHYSSHVQRYPTDKQIIGYSKYAKILEMHSWVWQNRYYENIGKDWETEWEEEPLWDDNSYLAQNYKWIPDDEKEFKRVINTAHTHSMKVVPYVSLLEGNLEKQILEIERLKNTYNIDGLYIDGLYPKNPEIAYEMARTLRNLFGEDGWLTLHNTRPAGYFFPFINTYMDYIITGEHDSFNRWTVTSYNISNAIASLWPEILLDIKDGREFLKKLVDDSLLYNNRVTLLTGEQGQWRYWRLYFTPQEMEFMQRYYFGALEKIKRVGYEKFILELKNSQLNNFKENNF